MTSRHGGCSAALAFIKMKPFRPNAKQTLKSYYQVPLEILEDAERLGEWAAQAISCQKKIRNLTRRKKL